jgi:large subunit ribosomal protein L29
MRIQEVRAKSDQELREELQGSYRELFQLRLRWQTRQLTNPWEIRKARKKLARILTVLRERELGLTRS